jgi:hypothetical protein
MSFHSTWLRRSPLCLSAGLLLVTLGCGSHPTDSVSTEPPLTSPMPSVAIAPDAAPTTQAPLNTSMVPSESRTLPPPLPVPQLIPPTSSTVHATALSSSAGRPDPFAPLTPSNVVVTARPIAPTPPVAPALPAPLTSLPNVSVSTLPLPSLQPEISSATPAEPIVPVQPLAETIEISGFLEVGGSTNLIVFVPGEQTSRPARVGEYLGNGNVLIKQVMPQSSGDVLVILEQDGVEYRRSVGSNPPTLVGSL